MNDGPRDQREGTDLLRRGGRIGQRETVEKEVVEGRDTRTSSGEYRNADILEWVP